MQTPKEKAYNIFKKFYNVDGQGFNDTISSKIARQCARLHINLTTGMSCGFCYLQRSTSVIPSPSVVTGTGKK